MADKIDPYTGATRAFVGQGLGMNWGDEGEAWLRSKMGEGEYSDIVNRIRDEYSQYSKQYPISSGALELAGGIAPGVAMMAVPGGQAPGSAQLQRSLLGTTAKLGAIGAGTGAISGAGSTTEDNRLSGAGGGALYGGAFGVGIPLLMRAGTAASRWMLDRLYPTDAAVTARAAEKVNRALSEDRIAPKDIQTRLQADTKLGVPSVTANVSPGLTDLAEAVAQRTGSGARTIETTLRNQRAGIRERTYQRVANDLKSGDYFQDQENLVRTLRQKANTVYDNAYAVGEIQDPRIMMALDTPAFKSAFQRAKSIADTEAAAARLRGEDPSKYMLRDVYYPREVKPGIFELELRNYPDVRTLDYMKRGIDANIDAGFRSAQGMSSAEASALKGLRNQFVSIIDDLVPEYKLARSAYAGDAEVIDAMRLGFEDFKKLKHEEVVRMVAGMSQAEKDAFRTGVARNIYQDVFGSSGRNFNAAQRVIGSPEVQAKLQPLFDNPGQFRLFKSSLEREAQLFEESNRVLGGSQTGKRMQMRENLEEGPGVGEAISSAVTGGFWPSLTGLVARSIRSTEMTEKTASKMADMLMSKDPHQVAAVVKLLENHAAAAVPRAARATAAEAGAVTGVTTALPPPTTPEPGIRVTPADRVPSLREELESEGAAQLPQGPDLLKDIEAEDAKVR